MSDSNVIAANEWTVDPVFTYARGGRLEGGYSTDAQAIWRHFSALVARDPLDLEAQVRRILLACQPPHRDKAFGALLDLFLALGDQGVGLRRMMLEVAQPCIESDEARFLAAHIDTGLARNALLPAGTGAILDCAVIGSFQAVRHERQALAPTSRVEEAISLLDHGDLPGARALLEEILIEDPTDVNATQELLAIYHHSRDAEAQQAMRTRLLERHGALPPAWA